MADSVIVSFKVVNDAIHPDEITRITRIQPTGSMLKGARRPELRLPRTNLWVIRSYIETMDLASQWAFVRDRMRDGDIEALKPQIGEGFAMFTIFFSTGNWRHNFQIPNDMIEMALFLGARIQVDS